MTNIEKEQIVKEYREGGITQEKLCSKYGINIGAFQYWIYHFLKAIKGKQLI